MNRAEALGLLRSLDLPHGDYAVFGSGPLLVSGIIDDAADLDVIARGAAWVHAQTTGAMVHLAEHGVTIASFFDGAVTVGNRWAIGSFSVDSLIDSADVIEGLPFVDLDQVRAYKLIADRPKDRDHIRRLDLWKAADSFETDGH